MKATTIRTIILSKLIQANLIPVIDQSQSVENQRQELVSY